MNSTSNFSNRMDFGYHSSVLGNLSGNLPQKQVSFVKNSTLNITQSLKDSQLTSSEILKLLCQALNNKKCSLNSPAFFLDHIEFNKMLNTVQYYESILVDSESTEWSVEHGESSTSSLDLSQASKEKLVCHILSKNRIILGKVIVIDPVNKFVKSKIVSEKNNNLDLLKNMQHFSTATIKDKYQVPHNFTKLSNIQNNGLKLNLFGVVTAINKMPTKSRVYWHSFLCISDPSLINNVDAPPDEFKMHLFLPFLQDHPEIHRGDVIRFTNVKVESHQNRSDGRIFQKEDLTVYCYWDTQAPLPRETTGEHSTVIRVLSKWWKLNPQYFDYLTPRPIIQQHYKYPGIRCLQESSDQLVFDLFCQVIGKSDDGSDFNFFYVRDGTIFTLQQRQEPNASAENQSRLDEKPTYGYLALVVFDSETWNKQVKSMKVAINDFLFLREARVVFLAEDAFNTMGTSYPFRHPCILLRLHSGGLADTMKKIPADHHEAVKIRSRLHRLPSVLEEMKSWRLPHFHPDEPDDLLARLADPAVQLNLLKRLKRF